MEAFECLDVIADRPVGHGECDICHLERSLWKDPETIDAGDFEYCEKCWRKLAAHKRWKERNR